MRARELARDELDVSLGSTRTEYVPRAGTTFRCEACRREVHDLRAVTLVRRAAAWRIECSSHDDGDHSIEAATLFGGGLHALEIYGELAAARWFDAGELFRTILRLRAQASGLYVAPREAFDSALGHPARGGGAPV